MKITRINKEYGYTVKYSCSVCGIEIIPEFFCKYGDTVNFDHDAIKFCSCGARLLDELVHETIDE
jgi:hypothetical protein